MILKQLRDQYSPIVGLMLTVLLSYCLFCRIALQTVEVMCTKHMGKIAQTTVRADNALACLMHCGACRCLKVLLHAACTSS